MLLLEVAVVILCSWLHDYICN